MTDRSTKPTGALSSGQSTGSRSGGGSGHRVLGGKGYKVVVRIAPVQHVTVSDAVAEQIQDLIMRGELKAGDRLPTEVKLAQAFGVGRTSIREALKALAAKGLIERSRRGTFVTGVGPAANITLAAAVRQASIRDVYEARLWLEVALAKKAAERATPEEIEELKEAAAAMELVDAGDAAALFHADMAFHAKLAEMADNSLVQEMLEAIQSRVYHVLRAAALSSEVVQRSLVNHRRLIAAIESGDAERAGQVMAEALMEAEAGYLRFIQTEQDEKEQR